MWVQLHVHVHAELIVISPCLNDYGVPRTRGATTTTFVVFLTVSVLCTLTDSHLCMGCVITRSIQGMFKLGELERDGIGMTLYSE